MGGEKASWCEYKYLLPCLTLRLFIIFKALTRYKKIYICCW